MTTILGILIGVGIMVYAIIGVSLQDPSTIRSVRDMYINVSSFYIVLGGTFASTLIAHPFSHLIRGFKAFFSVFIRKEVNSIILIEDICEFSQIYTQNSVRGLEERLKTYKRKNIIKSGIQMIINGYKIDEVKEFLELSVRSRYDIEMIDFYVFRTMARVSPAFGMVGTLVGLIYMLRVLADSPDRIGPFLAVALVTTFYGLIFSNLVFGPMGNKLVQHAELNLRVGSLEIEGVMLMLKKQHPVYIKDQLSGYLTVKESKKLFKQKAKPKAAAKKTEKK